MLNNLKEVRSQFPFLNKFIYLDAAHYTPYPVFVVDKINEFMKNFTTDYLNLSILNNELRQELRECAAKLINAEPDEIAVTGNTTHGINIFANGLNLAEDDNHVAFIDSEFPSVVYPWMNQEKLGRARCFKIPSSRGFVNETILKKLLLDKKIKVFNISHVQFLGYKYNIKNLSEFCKKHDILLLVDAIQSTGVNVVDVKKMGIDCLCTGNQKWFMSPAGVGFLYLSKKYMDIVSPTYVSTINVQYKFDNFLDYQLNFRDDCAVYENSTPNTIGMIGFIEVMKWFIELGVENIHQHIIELQDILIEKIDKTKYKIESDLDAEHRSGIFLMSHSDSSNNPALQKYLEENNVYIAVREGYLRIAPHIYNSPDDMNQLAVLLNNYNV